MTDQPFTICLWFDTEGEAAANYYASIFADSKIGRIARYTEAGPGPAGAVMTVEFELNGQKFLALNGGPQYTFTAAVSFVISCADQDEVDYYWSQLAEGGQEVACGWVTDRYGVSWQVVPAVLADLRKACEGGATAPRRPQRTGPISRPARSAQAMKRKGPSCWSSSAREPGPGGRPAPAGARS